MGGKKENKQERKERKKNGEREEEKMRFSRHSDDRISTVGKEKSIHALRAMRGYQNLGVSSNSTR